MRNSKSASNRSIFAHPRRLKPGLAQFGAFREMGEEQRAYKHRDRAYEQLEHEISVASTQYLADVGLARAHLAMQEYTGGERNVNQHERVLEEEQHQIVLPTAPSARGLVLAIQRDVVHDVQKENRSNEKMHRVFEPGARASAQNIGRKPPDERVLRNVHYVYGQARSDHPNAAAAAGRIVL